MTSPIDLLENGEAVTSTYNSTEVVQFKAASEGKRVIANSQHYIGYNLKKLSVLRIIQRQANAKCSFKGHTTNIHDVRFVNFCSNVGASASPNEFYVWVVSESKDDTKPEGLTLLVRPYFKVSNKVTISSFSFFINSTTNSPDVLILYESKASLLESSRLIAKYEDAELKADLAQYSIELRPLEQPAGEHTLCATSKNEWFAFTTARTKVSACSRRNPRTPPWACCHGDAVKGLQLLSGGAGPQDSSLHLVACSEKLVFQWSLSGASDPVLLRTFTMGQKISALLASCSTFAVFDTARHLALASLTGDSYDRTLYNFDFQVHGGGITFHSTEKHVDMLVDLDTKIIMVQMASKAATAPVTAPAAAPLLNDPAVLMTSTPGQRDVVAKPLPAPPAVAAPVVAAAPPMATAVPLPRSTAPPASRVALSNPALPPSQNDGVAAIIKEADDAVSQSLVGVRTVTKNIAEILQLTPDRVTKEHEDLLKLGLEAQMTTLQAQPLGGASPDTDAIARQKYSYVVLTTMANVSDSIAAGVVGGLEEVFSAQLDKTLQNAFGDSVKESVKAVVKRKLDEEMSASSTFFKQAMTERLERFGKEMENALGALHATVMQLTEDNLRLQSAINNMVRSETATQVRQLRQEVQQLRQTVRALSSGPSSYPTSTMGSSASPETILTTTLDLMEQGSFPDAMSLLANTGNPRLTFQALSRLDEPTYYKAISCETSDNIWCDIISAVVDNEAAATREEIKRSATFAFELLSERPDLLRGKTMKPRRLLKKLIVFLDRARQAGVPALTLRPLEMCVAL